MRAVGVFQGRKEVQLVEHVAPKISHDDEVKIRSLEVGICGTDREICNFEYGTPPEGSEFLVLGHEALGEVVEAGSSASEFKPGDLVVHEEEPFNAETAPAVLAEHPLTAADAFYVRGHGAVPEVEALAIEVLAATYEDVLVDQRHRGVHTREFPRASHNLVRPGLHKFRDAFRVPSSSLR